MFHRLHLQLTLFCTMVTGCIFFVLTFICLAYAERSLNADNYTSFLRQLNSTLIHLQEQDAISHQWLGQVQENGQFMLFLYDNKTPLYYQAYHDSVQENQLRDEAIRRARTEYDTDIFSTDPHPIIVHTEFEFTSSAGHDYYASAGMIPKGRKHLGFLILAPLQKQQNHIRHLRLVIFLADLAALSLLIVFSWFFTGRMIVPLEHTRQKQVDFIASASHELRAPLTVVRMGMEVIQNGAGNAHFIELMTEECVRMQNLIDDMLLLANADSSHLPMRMTVCQPDELLLNVYEKYESLAAEKKIALSIHLSEKRLPDCTCDRARIIQVFSILLDNALSYTPSGGTIRLSLTLERSHLVFRFADMGRGIPDREKNLVFDRFYRSDEAHTDRQHFGLGLCIAKEIITAHHGKIWVEDSAWGGSCFCIRLPGTPGNSTG